MQTKQRKMKQRKNIECRLNLEGEGEQGSNVTRRNGSGTARDNRHLKQLQLGFPK
jgi:hypothetical protein